MSRSEAQNIYILVRLGIMLVPSLDIYLVQDSYGGMYDAKYQISPSKRGTDDE